MSVQRGGPAQRRLAEEMRRLIGEERGAQQEAAILAGVTRSSVSRWVSGDVVPSYDSLNRYGLALDPRDAHRLFDLQDRALAERGRAAHKAKTAHPARDLETQGSPVARASLFEHQEGLYTAVASALDAAIQGHVEPRTLDWAMLQGMGGPREDDRTARVGATAAIQRFDRAVQYLLNAHRGTERWHVRQVCNIDSPAALERILRILSEREGCAADYEVWTYSVRDAPPVLSPFILAGRWVFLAPEDARAYRVASGVCMEDERVGTWARMYFEQLVGHADQLRSAGGVDRAVVSRLRRRMKSR